MRRNVFFYFKKSVAFFDIKAKAVPPVVFLAVLALYAIYFYIVPIDYITYSQPFSQNQAADFAIDPYQLTLGMTAGIVIMLLINVVSFVYLDAAIREAKGEDYTHGVCIRSALSNFVRLTCVTIVKNIILFTGLFLFVVPGIFMFIVLIFAECAVLDKGKGILASLRYSAEATKGKRGVIFKIELFTNVILFIFVILLLNIFSSNNAAVFQYILLFIMTMLTLIEHKLTAYIYVDAVSVGGKQESQTGLISGPQSPPDNRLISGPPSPPDNRLPENPPPIVLPENPESSTLPENPTPSDLPNDSQPFNDLPNESPSPPHDDTNED